MGYARDDMHVFWKDQLLKTKVQDFVMFGDGYAEDNYHQFIHGTIMKKKPSVNL